MAKLPTALKFGQTDGSSCKAVSNVYRLDKARHKGNKWQKRHPKTASWAVLVLYRGNWDLFVSSPLVRFELQRTEMYLKRKPFIRVCGYEDFFLHSIYHDAIVHQKHP